jgi:hypothetical protein
LNDTLSGNFAVGSSTATLTFTDQSIVIGGVTYTLNSKVFTFPTLGPPTHIDTLFGSVTSAAPEPSFMALTGLGFFALAGLFARRKKQSSNATTL